MNEDQGNRGIDAIPVTGLSRDYRRSVSQLLMNYMNGSSDMAIGHFRRSKPGSKQLSSYKTVGWIP